MHCTISFFASLGENPYFQPGSFDLAWFLGSLASSASSGGNSSKALATMDAKSSLLATLPEPADGADATFGAEIPSSTKSAAAASEGNTTSTPARLSLTRSPPAIDHHQHISCCL